MGKRPRRRNRRDGATSTQPASGTGPRVGKRTTKRSRTLPMFLTIRLPYLGSVELAPHATQAQLNASVGGGPTCTLKRPLRSMFCRAISRRKDI